MATGDARGQRVAPDRAETRQSSDPYGGIPILTRGSEFIVTGLAIASPTPQVESEPHLRPCRTSRRMDVTDTERAAHAGLRNQAVNCGASRPR